MLFYEQFSVSISQLVHKPNFSDKTHVYINNLIIASVANFKYFVFHLRAREVGFPCELTLNCLITFISEFNGLIRIDK